MTPEELASHIRDLVARHRISQRELEFLKRDRDRLQALLAERPTAKEHEDLQAELKQTTKAYEAELRRMQVRNGRRG